MTALHILGWLDGDLEANLVSKKTISSWSAVAKLCISRPATYMTK